MAKSWASARAIMLLTGGRSKDNSFKRLNEIYDNVVIHKDTMKDVMDTIKKVPKEEVEAYGFSKAEDALGAYLIAARTEELAARYPQYTRPAGFEKESAKRLLANAPAGIKKAAQSYWNVNVNLVNILQQQGMISKELGNKLRAYKRYCPMYRDMSDGMDIDTKISELQTNAGFVNISSPVKPIDMGSKRAVLDPITSMTRYVAAALDRCERNNVGKTLIKFDVDFEGMGRIVVKDPTMNHASKEKCAFAVWVNGKKEIYRTTPEIYAALADMNEASANAILQGARKIAQALRRGATISPSFIVRNFIRDTIAASVNSKTRFIPIYSSLKGAYKLVTDDAFANAYYSSGASMGTYIRSDLKSADNVVRDMLGDKYKNYPAGLKQIRILLDRVWRLYDAMGNVIEDSSRAAEFDSLMRKKKLTVEQAGYLARDITLNFSRSGTQDKSFNRYIPFFNATIQGTDKFIRTFKENPIRAIVATVAYIIAPSIFLWAMNHDDDWYKELDEETKLTNWAISLGGGKHLLIPKPQEVGILFGGGAEAVLRSYYDHDPKAMGEWARQYVATMLPGFYYAAARPLIEWQTNYSFWTGRNLVSARLQKMPSEMQFTNNTSELAKVAGDTWLAKKMKLSPIAVDNWISGYAGSAGRTVAKLLDTPIEAVRGTSKPPSPSKYWYEMPFVGSFIRQDGEHAESINRLYDLQKDISDEEQRGHKQKGKEQVDAAVKSVGKLTKEIREIQDSRTMHPDRKRAEIDKRREKMRYYAKKAVQTYGEPFGY